MANYPDITLDSSWATVPAADENVIIYAHGGPVRFTSHTSPTGNTVGIPLSEGVAHEVRAGTGLMARSDTCVPVTLVRVTA